MGFLVAGFLLRVYYSKGRSGLNAEQQMDLITAIILGVVIGGRIGYVFLYDFKDLLGDPLSIFRVWEGGMSSHGGFIGIIFGVYWFCLRSGQSFVKIADIAATLGPAGVFFGRLANFINGELWGKVTDVPWAFLFPKSGYYSQILGQYMIEPRHPSQLYAAGLEGLFLFLYVQFRFWFTNVSRRRPGRLVGELFIGYALVRIFGEIYREPDRGIELILGLSRGQFYSIFMILIGALFIYNSSSKRHQHSQH